MTAQEELPPSKWLTTHNWNDLIFARDKKRFDCAYCSEWEESIPFIMINYIGLIFPIITFISLGLEIRYTNLTIQDLFESPIGLTFMGILVIVAVVNFFTLLVHHLSGEYLYLFWDQKGYMHCHQDIYAIYDLASERTRYYFVPLYGNSVVPDFLQYSEIKDIIVQLKVGGIFKSDTVLWKHVDKYKNRTVVSFQWKFKLHKKQIMLEDRTDPGIQLILPPQKAYAVIARIECLETAFLNELRERTDP